MLQAPAKSKLSTSQEAVRMSSLVPIGDVAETPLPNIAMKASSEPLDASQTRMIKEKEVRVCISKRTNLQCHQCNSSCA